MVKQVEGNVLQREGMEMAITELGKQADEAGFTTAKVCLLSDSCTYSAFGHVLVNNQDMRVLFLMTVPGRKWLRIVGHRNSWMHSRLAQDLSVVCGSCSG